MPKKNVANINVDSSATSLVTVDVTTSLETTKDLLNLLTEIRNDNEHDDRIAAVYDRAIDAYTKIMANVTNTPDPKLYEAASLLLKVCLDSANAITSRKLKVADLKIKQAKTAKEEDDGNTSAGMFDRNKVMDVLYETSSNSKKR